MSNAKQALVLHLSGVGQPLLIEVAADGAEELAGRLAELIRHAKVESIEAANGAKVAVNFAAVQVAHVDVVSGIGQLYGSPPRT
ncbi:MAG TPA: hypothetical protein VG247_09705 [Pseudonocardiaceae bacterium]|jgi:hypothetical protein|nr:hypothetical protein [Pseudonocardiaceae bacterium]